MHRVSQRTGRGLKHRNVVVGMLALGAGIGGATVAYATIPDSGGVIHGVPIRRIGGHAEGRW